MKSLYHGSIYDIDTINVAEGRGYKDFGKGFYATAVKSHADSIAIRNKAIAENKQAILCRKLNIRLNSIVAYRYNLVFSEELDGLRVKVFTKADSEWLRFVVRNRKCEGCAHDYDIVIGPTADAEATVIISEYVDELEAFGYTDEICEKVISELKPENLPKQYFFRTVEAVKTLKFDKIKRQVVG